MNDLEQRLVQDLERVAAGVHPPEPPLRQLMDAGTLRRRRRRAAVLATGAAAVLVLIASVGLGPRFLSRPTPAQHAAPQGRTLPAVPRPLCDLGQLQVTSTNGGPALGTFYVPIRLRNTGPACLLDPRQTAVAMAPSSGVPPTRLEVPEVSQRGRVLSLSTGSAVLLHAGFRGDCVYLRKAPPGTVGIRLIVGAQEQPLARALHVLPHQSCRPFFFLEGLHHQWVDRTS